MIDNVPMEPRIPERTSDAFSRQWYASGGWKLDEPTIMGKVDRTTTKMADLLLTVSRLGTNGIIPPELHSSLFDHLQWMMKWTGAHKMSWNMDNSVRYVDKTEKIYPRFGIVKKRDWDGIVFADKKERKFVSQNYCVVMPSMETVRWLNEVSAYCNEMDEWAKGTYLRAE